MEDAGARLENVAALHLLKACEYWTDVAAGDFALRFLRTKEKEEVDFVVLRDRKPWMLVECKSSELRPSPTLVKFTARLRPTHSLQLVTTRGHDRVFPEARVRVLEYERFFASLV